MFQFNYKGRKQTVSQAEGCQGGWVSSRSQDHPSFPSIQAFNWLDGAHPPQEKQIAQLHLLI